MFKNNIFTNSVFFDEKTHHFALIATFAFIVFLNPLQSHNVFFNALPNYFYLPDKLSIAYYFFPSIPNNLTIYIWGIVNLLLQYLVLLTSFKNKIKAALLLCLSLTFLYAIFYSFGKIDHDYANIIFIPFAVLSLSKKNIWSLNTVFFILLFSFFSSGIFKFLDYRYLFLDYHAVLSFIQNKDVLNWLNSIQDNAIIHSALLEIMDYAAIIFEVFFAIVVALNYKLINLFIFFACIFHCLNNYLLFIPFDGQQYIYLFLSFIIFFHHHPKTVNALKKIGSNLNKNVLFTMILSVLIMQCIYMKNNALFSVLNYKFSYYSFYIILGTFNCYLFILTIKNRRKTITNL